jgi:hypothetical protein
MQEFNLQSTSFKLRGHWHVPGFEEKVAGELIYDEHSLRLLLQGGLNKAISVNPISSSPNQINFSVVHGTLVDKSVVTLLNCFYTSFTPNLDFGDFSYPRESQLLKSELSCGTAIIGDHLKSDEDVFSSGQFEFPQLEEWLGVSPFTVNCDNDQNVNIHFSLPSEDRYDLKDFNLTLKHAIRPPSLPLGKNPSAEYTAFFVALPNSSQTLKWFMSLNGELSAFLSYLYGGNILSKRLLLKSHALGEYLSIYYPRHRTDDKSIEPHNFWTTYEELKACFPSLLDSWLTANYSHRQARRMLLSSERRPSAYTELRFLPLVQALEVLTQAIEPTELVTDQEFQSIKELVRKTIPSGTNQELVESFMRSLGYANGKSLKFKIEQLLTSLPPNMISLLCKDVKKFTKGIVNTRNFYTHYSHQKCILDGKEIHWATRKLIVLLRVLLLRSTGLAEDILLRVLQRNMKVSNDRRAWLNVSEIGTAEGTIRSEN